MNAVYTSATFANAYEYRKRAIAYPFRDDPTRGRIITRFFEVLSGSYTAPVLDTADTEVTTAYCVGTSAIDHVDGELMRYSAQFATIPPPRNEYESYSFRLPGFTATFTPTEKTITGMTIASTRNFATRYCPGHGMTTGQGFSEQLTLRVSIVGEQGTRTVTIVTSGIVTGHNVDSYSGSIFIPYGPGDGSTVAFVSGTVATGGGTSMPARGPLTVAAHSRVSFDYFLPGVSSGIAQPSDILLPQPVAFIDSAGAEVDILTATTIPTAAQYQARVTAGEEFVVEAYFRAWMGNIFERRVRWMAYQ